MFVNECIVGEDGAITYLLGIWLVVFFEGQVTSFVKLAPCFNLKFLVLCCPPVRARGHTQLTHDKPAQ